MFIDIPPQHQERVICAITASIKYAVPANIVLAVAEKEAGKPGQWVRNTNGTHDVGVMQFNTTYLKQLSHYGITANDVAAKGCYPYDLAAWRLHGHISKDTGDIWTRAANYHSRTPKYNAIYRADLIKKANKWAAWIQKNLTKNPASLPEVAATLPKVVHTVEHTKPSTQVAMTSVYVPRAISIKNGNE